jgi:type II secretory pathway component PulJ
MERAERARETTNQGKETEPDEMIEWDEKISERWVKRVCFHWRWVKRVCFHFSKRFEC